MTVFNRKPIIYDDIIDIRFSDLDHYNHVNSKHYIDLVSTARLTFLAKRMNFPIEKVTENGIGFFMIKSIVNYKRPIIGLQKVRIKSHVADIRDEKILIIPFEVCTEDDSKIFADGILEFATIDMTTKRTTILPDWALNLFFDKHSQ
jgi:YbgC/YbaW family acyl-CoA thioester hydrolase